MAAQQRGFTLVEIVVAIGIIGILMAIALPSYQDYVTRGRLAEAISGLSDARVRMEQFYQDNRTYPTDCTTGTPAATQVRVQALQNFTLACDQLTANTYRVTATGIGPMTGFTYTIDQSNARTSTFASTGASKGYSPASPNNCWVIRKGGLC